MQDDELNFIKTAENFVSRDHSNLGNLQKNEDEKKEPLQNQHLVNKKNWIFIDVNDCKDFGFEIDMINKNKIQNTQKDFDIQTYLQQTCTVLFQYHIQNKNNWNFNNFQYIVDDLPYKTALFFSDAGNKAICSTIKANFVLVVHKEYIALFYKDDNNAYHGTVYVLGKENIKELKEIKLDETIKSYFTTIETNYNVKLNIVSVKECSVNTNLSYIAKHMVMNAVKPLVPEIRNHSSMLDFNLYSMFTDDTLKTEEIKNDYVYLQAYPIIRI
jgi:hypothetical protein